MSLMLNMANPVKLKNLYNAFTNIVVINQGDGATITARKMISTVQV